jgi:hypothetical protein
VWHVRAQEGWFQGYLLFFVAVLSICVAKLFSQILSDALSFAQQEEEALSYTCMTSPHSISLIESGAATLPPSPSVAAQSSARGCSTPPSPANSAADSTIQTDFVPQDASFPSDASHCMPGTPALLNQEQLAEVARRLRDAMKASRISFQQLFVQADSSQEARDYNHAFAR